MSKVIPNDEYEEMGAHDQLDGEDIESDELLEITWADGSSEQFVCGLDWQEMRDDSSDWLAWIKVTHNGSTIKLYLRYADIDVRRVPK